jgi:HTH-type transcriptional regulator/antitoxin HigA
MEGVNMSNQTVEQVMKAWPLISSFVFVPHTEAEYDQVVALLDELIDEVGEDEDHPLASLMELLGTLIEKYEAEHVPELVG